MHILDLKMDELQLSFERCILILKSRQRRGLPLFRRAEVRLERIRVDKKADDEEGDQMMHKHGKYSRAVLLLEKRARDAVQLEPETDEEMVEETDEKMDEKMDAETDGETEEDEDEGGGYNGVWKICGGRFIGQSASVQLK